MKTYKFDEQQSILWSEQLDENTRQSGFIRIGKTEQRDTGEVDKNGEPIFETVDVYQELIDSGVEIEAYVAPEPTPHELKLAGVEFEGVMCSATAEDQHGLADIEGIVKSGMSINFHFENGTKLLLTPDNIDALRAVWFPFRLSFFA